MCEKCNGSGKLQVTLVKEKLYLETNCNECRGTGKSKSSVTCKTCFDTGKVTREWCSSLLIEVDCPNCKKEEK